MFILQLSKLKLCSTYNRLKHIHLYNGTACVKPAYTFKALFYLLHQWCKQQTMYYKRHIIPAVYLLLLRHLPQKLCTHFILYANILLPFFSVVCVKHTSVFCSVLHPVRNYQNLNYLCCTPTSIIVVFFVVCFEPVTTLQYCLIRFTHQQNKQQPNFLYLYA